MNKKAKGGVIPKTERSVFIDVLSERLKKAEEKIEAMQELLDDKDSTLLDRELRIAHLVGMIDGLKFALRCNGISGGDVR